MKEAISKNESLALRGLCITLVILHNFIHIVVPFTENEKYFDPAIADYFINHFFEHPMMGFFSYIGCYSLPMFFFLSGYGLKKKYNNDVPNKLSFIVWHYLKLVLLAGPVIILSNILVKTPFLHITGQLTLLNHIFAYDFIRPASFWYIRTAFEFYILYAIILHRINPKILIGIAFIVSCSFYLVSWPVVEMLKYFFIGYFLEFSLGVFVAQYDYCIEYIENKWVSILLLVLLLFSSVNEQTWIFSSCISILFLLSIKKYLTNRVFIYIGSISALIYATHAVIRNVWHNHIFVDYMNGNVLLITLSISGYLITCVVAAVIYGKYYNTVISFLKKKIKLTDK